nr:uncharacterized protein LOC127130643 [Pisum sativum]
MSTSYTNKKCIDAVLEGTKPAPVEDKMEENEKNIAGCGVRSHAHLRAEDLKTSPLTSRYDLSSHNIEQGVTENIRNNVQSIEAYENLDDDKDSVKGTNADEYVGTSSQQTNASENVENIESNIESARNESDASADI